MSTCAQGKGQEKWIEADAGPGERPCGRAVPPQSRWRTTLNRWTGALISDAEHDPATLRAGAVLVPSIAPGLSFDARSSDSSRLVGYSRHRLSISSGRPMLWFSFRPAPRPTASPSNFHPTVFFFTEKNPSRILRSSGSMKQHCFSRNTISCHGHEWMTRNHKLNPKPARATWHASWKNRKRVSMLFYQVTSSYVALGLLQRGSILCGRDSFLIEPYWVARFGNRTKSQVWWRYEALPSDRT